MKPAREVRFSASSGQRAGSDNHNAKLDEYEVELLRQLHEDYGWPYSALAAVFGLSKGGVAKVCSFQRWNCAVLIKQVRTDGLCARHRRRR